MDSYRNNINLYTGIHSVTAQPFVANNFIYTPSYNALPTIYADASTDETINYVQSGEVKLVPISFNVKGLSAGDTADAIINNNGYSASQFLSNGLNSIQVPNVGTYIIQLQSSEHERPSNGVIKVINGIAQGNTNIVYMPNNTYIVGYVDYGSAQTNLRLT